MKKEKALLIGFILLLFISDTFAQTPQNVVEITLPDSYYKIQNRQYYISKVIDGRQNQSNIGLVRKGLFNKVVPAHLKYGFTQSIQGYLSKFYPDDSNQTPIILKILKFEISERVESNTEVGRHEMAVEFYREKNGQLFRLYNCQTYYEVRSGEVTRFHKNSIVFNLYNCLKKLNDEVIDINTGSLVEDAELAKKVDIREDLFPKKVHQPKFLHLFFLTTSYGIQSTPAVSFGFLFYQNPLKYKLPIVFGLNDNFLIVKSDNEKKEHSLFFAEISMGIAKPIKPRLNLLIQGIVPIVIDQYTNFQNKDKTHRSLGVGASQEIIWMPKIEKKGVIIGVGIYEFSIPWQKDFKYDLGVRLRLGAKF